MQKFFAIVAAAFFATTPLTATAQELPESFDDWIVVLEQECGNLKIEMRRTVTLDGTSEAMPVWWNDELINLSVEEGDGETSTTGGVYNGVWTIVEVVDEQTEERAQRLIEASIIQAGGQDGLDAFETCRSEIQKQVFREIREGFGEMEDMMKGLGDALKEGFE